MKLLSALALAMLPATPVLAEPWSCEFTVECIAGENCGESAYQVEIIAADHEGQLFLTSLVGDILVDRLSDDGDVPAVYASAGEHGGSEMITINDDLSALMSVHIFDGVTMSVTYFGTCEAL